MTYKKWLQLVIFSFLAFMLLAAIAGKLIIQPIYNPELFVLDDSFNTVVVGSSQSSVSFNPEYLNHTRNLADSGEPIFYAYYKLKTLLKNNKHIKRVMIAFSPVHISKYQDYHMFTGSAGSRKFIMSNFIFMDGANDKYIKKLSFDYMVGVLKYDLGLPLNYMEDLPFMYKYYIKGQKHKALYIGQDFVKIFNSHITDEIIKEKSDFYFYGDDKEMRISDAAVESFNRMVNLATENNIELVVVYTPVHKKFEKLMPDFYIERYREIINANRNKIVYYDLHDENFADDEFYDGDHLNEKGSIHFSSKLQDLLSKRAIN